MICLRINLQIAEMGREIQCPSGEVSTKDGLAKWWARG